MCAQIYPLKEDLNDIPHSELTVYDLLSKLDDTFTVFHSVQWFKNNYLRKSTWKENDFLIFHQQLGGLVLEIKGGDIEYTGKVFHQINSKTKSINELSPQKGNDPLSQAIDGTYHYRNLLDSISINLSNRYPIEPAVWFSSCNIKEKMNSFPLNYREARGAILGYEDFKKGCQAIIDIFKFYGSQGKTQIVHSEYKKILESIAQDFSLISAPASKRNELDLAFIRLTNEQTGLLDYISEQKFATIQGVAGTGKTLIAKEAARRFGESGRKVLFICFNRFLYLYLKEKFPYKNVEYCNIHTFIKKHHTNNEDLSNSLDRANALLEINPNSIDIDDIIIDEAQDFENDEIIFFKILAEQKNGHLYIFYDKNQLLLTKEVPSWIKESECKLLLNKNCRNTYEIATTSYNVIDLDLNPKIMMVRGEITEVCFTENNTLEKIEKLIERLTNKKYDYRPEDIVILSLKKENSSILSFSEKLYKFNIVRDRRKKDNILFTTSIKFKGLESKVVIIIDIDENAFSIEEKKRNFYVACSRATQKLILFIDGDQEKLKQIANTIATNTRYAPKGIILTKTKSNKLEL